MNGLLLLILLTVFRVYRGENQLLLSISQHEQLLKDNSFIRWWDKINQNLRGLCGGGYHGGLKRETFKCFCFHLA